MLRWLIFLLPVSVAAYCPEFFKNQTACSCSDYLDGSVIRCSGQDGPKMIEQMKKLHFEIRELTLENANIIEIGPRAFKNLRIKKLVLDKNRIKAIHRDAFRGLENVLQELSIANNKMTEVPSDAVAGMRALNVLSLKCNKIGNLTKPVFVNLTSLIDVNLSCNEICELSSNVFDGVRSTLQNLILDMNCIKKFPAEAVQNMESLIALHLKYNQINSIDEGQLKNLSSLSMISLTSNNISFIHPSALRNTPNLRYVYLAENQLHSFEPGTMSQFSQTQVLDLAFNQLTEIKEDTFAGLESLQHLNLESNNIKSIAPGAFAGIPLLLLWLPNNCLNSISPVTFQGALFLRQLSLANNNIKEIEPLSLNHLANLHTVDLANNKIRSLQQGAIQGSDHLTVRLQENPMVCSQDGFHVMNGPQAINLTNEANKICKTNWHEDTPNICPKALLRPEPPLCCNRKSTTTNLTPSITTSTRPIEKATTSGEDDEEDVEESGESSNEGDESVISHSKKTHTAETTATMYEESVATTQASKRKINMDRFWRLSHRPAVDSPFLRHQVNSVLKPKYLKTTAAPLQHNTEKSEEDDANKESEDDNDVDEEVISQEEEDATTETTIKTSRIPARIRERQKMLSNMPPWLHTYPKDKIREPEEDFNKDDDTETVQVDEHMKRPTI
ncbi:leucine Rich repeat-containing domain protein [Dictyocaulus viviparus]|uniref:Leucine Rich repeat-containing domain protein n=1 Tax=Dictyocaulus viviparus TaxID=29172 RepID=A0A0D8XAV9_DICVI|nr:leucine Rich repeat-containing domain protein [Dictyocaulus viviparus]